MKIGSRQEKVLNAIIAYYEKEGYLPSYEELCDTLELKSVSTVHYHIQLLLKAGFLSKVEGKSRAYKIIYTAKGDPYHFEVIDTRNILAIPVLTTDMVGTMIFDKNEFNEYLYLPEVMLGKKEGFALKILNDDLKDAGILYGDYLLFIEASEPNNDDFVIILSGDEIAPARCYFEQGRANYLLFGQRETIYADSAMMIGKVVGNYRDLR